MQPHKCEIPTSCTLPLPLPEGDQLLITHLACPLLGQGGIGPLRHVHVDDAVDAVNDKNAWGRGCAV